MNFRMGLKQIKQIKQNKTRQIALIAIVAGTLMLSSCNNAATTATDANARSATLGNGSLTATVSATGNIQAESDVKLSFQQPGTVAEVNVKVGDTVKKDDVLAKLDTTDLEHRGRTGRRSSESATRAACTRHRGTQGERAEYSGLGSRQLDRAG